MILQMAFLPGLGLTVLITSPDFLPSSVQHPFRITLFLGYILTFGHRMVLLQVLKSILVAVFAGEGKLFYSIIMESLDKLIRIAFSIPNHFTSLVWDGHTS